MSAELLENPTFNDLHGAMIIKAKLFSPGDNVVVKNYLGVTMKVIEYKIDPRTGDERVIVCWFNKDLTLVEAFLPEVILEAATEKDEKEYQAAFGA